MILYNNILCKILVVNQGCSSDQLPNAVLTPTDSVNGVFNMTCLRGFKTVNGAQFQIIECVNGDWTTVSNCTGNYLH